MVMTCSALGCLERHKKDSNISFHCFPANQILRKKWVIAIKRNKFIPTSASRVCGKHFKNEDFKQLQNSIHLDKQLKILKLDAIPSIFNFPSHIQKNEPGETKSIVKNRESTDILHSTSLPCTKSPMNKQNSQQCDNGTSSMLRATRRRPSQIGDFRLSDLKCKIRRNYYWNLTQKVIKKHRKTIKYLRNQNYRLKKQIKRMNDVISHLKGYNKISNNCFPILKGKDAVRRETIIDLPDYTVIISDEDINEEPTSPNETNNTSRSPLDIESLAESLKELLEFDCTTYSDISSLIVVLDINILSQFFQYLSNNFSLCLLIKLGEILCENGQNCDYIICYCENILTPQFQNQRYDQLELLFVKFYDAFPQKMEKFTFNIILNNKKCIYLPAVLKQLKSQYKIELLRAFVTDIQILQPIHIPVLESLLTSSIHRNLVKALIEVLADSTINFQTDKTFGKLVLNIIETCDVYQSELQIRRILSEHKSTWKQKCLNVLSTKIDCSQYSQSFGGY